ncbi:heme utilization protein [Acinetobacter dispersus]|uniref:DUF6160 family protein n=1 Tax=Acinetobacter dispersus TaxID=70348 RepID=UPI001F4A63AF|nr:DUF6160 family protein [Acinetobacter dispersus]MCH7384115.1 heme utilization protein [Acinetobacter dispersus]
MKNKNVNHRKISFALNTLAASIFFISHSAYALQALDDSALRSVNAQDGVHIETTYDNINVDQFYWQDNAGRGSSDAVGTTLKAVANNFRIQKNALGDQLGTNYKLNTGSNGAKTGLDIELSSNPSLITIGSFQICDPSRCSSDIGNLAIQTTSPLDLKFKTTDGLFSKNSQASLELGLKNATVYLGQTSNSQLNQLILKNFNFNFLGKGVMFVDAAEGMKLQTNNALLTGNAVNASLTQTPNGDYGYVDFTRVKDTGAVTAGTYSESGVATNSGLNLEFMLNKNVNPSSPYTLDSTNTPLNQQAAPNNKAQGLIRVGANGRMVNGSLQVRGLNANAAIDPNYSTNYGDPNGTNILGKTSDGKAIMGDTGVAFRMKAEFTKDGDSMLGSDGKATTLEIGGAGLNTYGFEFGNLTGLQLGTRGSFDTGNVYINLVDAKSVYLPANYIFQTSKFGNGSFLTQNSDYIQSIHTQTGTTNPYSLLMAIRGAEFQAISRRGRFTNSATNNPESGYAPITEHTDNNWGLALPFYNLNANMAMYGTRINANEAFYFDKAGVKRSVASSGDTPRLGFSLGMSTTGVDRDTSYTALGNKTTSILVIDGAKNYYMGLRNIDMLLKGTGTIGLENGSLNATLKDMLIVMAAEVAAGYLPGTSYSGGVAPNNNFALSNDVLFGLKLRVGGDMNLSLIPNNEYRTDGTGNAMNIVGDLKLNAASNNTIQISDPVDGSALGLDNIQGDLAFNNAIQINRHSSGEGVVSFNTALTFNPNRTADGVFRTRDINLYAPSGGAQRLGEMAITGGRLTSQLSIMPRN